MSLGFLRLRFPNGGLPTVTVDVHFENCRVMDHPIYSRRAECLERHLAGWSGLLQCDGYAAYRKLAEADRPGGAVTLACCWSHLSPHSPDDGRFVCTIPAIHA